MPAKKAWYAIGVVVLGLLGASCAAQPDIDAVAIGEDVAVTRADGGVVEGTVTSRDDTSLHVTTGTTTKSIPRREIVEVSVVDGVTPASLPPAATFREYTVPEDTKLLLTLTTPFNSGTSVVGDRVEATLAEAVSVGTAEVLPAGSLVTGTVSAVEGSGKVKGLASITLHFTSVAVAGRPDHDEIDATYSETAAATNGEDAAKIGIDAGAGAVIGGLLGGKGGAAKGAAIGGGAGTTVVLATAGDEVEYRAGARLTVALERSVDVRVPIV